MEVKHTQKISGFYFLPDDLEEPPIGSIVEVPVALGAHLITRGWGVDVTPESEKDEDGNPHVLIVVEREDIAYRAGLFEQFEERWSRLNPKAELPQLESMRTDALEKQIADMTVSLEHKAKGGFKVRLPHGAKHEAKAHLDPLFVTKPLPKPHLDLPMKPTKAKE